MPIELSKLKSAVVVTDRDEIFQRLTKARGEEGAAPAGLKGQTFVERLKDGQVKVEKSSGLSILGGDGAPAIPDDASIEALAVKRGLRWDPEYLQRKQSWWLSDERPDGSGDIVLANWHFDLFEGNSPMADNHDWGGLPIGKFIDWRVCERRAKDYSGPALWVLGLFAMGSELQKPEQIRRLVQGGMMPGCSAGFVASKVIDVKDDAEREALGLGRYGYILDENHLLEGSPTMLGCNPAALAIYTEGMKKGLLLEGDFTFIRDCQRRKVRKGRGDKAAWEEIDGQTVALAKLLFPKAFFKPHPELDQPMESEEDLRLRHFTPPAAAKSQEDAAKKTVEEQLAILAKGQEDLRAGQAQFQEYVQQWTMSQTQMLQDIRDILEEAAAAPAQASHREEESGVGAEHRGTSRKEGNGGGEKKDSRVLQLVLDGLKKK